MDTKTQDKIIRKFFEESRYSLNTYMDVKKDRLYRRKTWLCDVADFRHLLDIASIELKHK